MIIKLFIFIFAFMCGFFAISVFPSMAIDDLSFFISALILSPVRFFLGMIGFITTIIAFSYIIRSLIAATVRRVKGNPNSGRSLAIDYFLFFTFFLLMKFSVLITLLLVVFSIVFCILTVDLANSRSDEGNS